MPDPESYDPWTVVLETLSAQAIGAPPPHSIDELTFAAEVLVGVYFTNAGIPESKVVEMLDRPHKVKLSYDGSTDEIGVEIIWDDGQEMKANVPIP